ncbi:germ cell nuclear acidic protein-like [Chlorocebus sabaeus]|uniref:germ cell nuclear acidic protein-like n=1 Tax=Chlorocebus sabaeus TaxID=60711 RepID=UPI003BFA1E73
MSSRLLSGELKGSEQEVLGFTSGSAAWLSAYAVGSPPFIKYLLYFCSYILNVQSSSDDTNGSSVARTVPRRQVSCILNVRSRSGDTNGSSVTRRALKRQASYILNVQSSSDDTNGSSVTRRALKRQASSVVVIDSDSDDDCYTYEEKKAKLLEINSNGKYILLY